MMGPGDDDLERVELESAVLDGLEADEDGPVPVGVVSLAVRRRERGLTDISGLFNGGC
jgi:hypothetical protein